MSNSRKVGVSKTVSANDVLIFVVKHQETWGYPPTMAEIGLEFRRSKQWAHTKVARLAADGLIRLRAREHRNIIVI